MSKRKHKLENEKLFSQIEQSSESTSDDVSETNHSDILISDEALANSLELSGLLRKPARRELPRMKKFRFQLLHEWILANVDPCRVADIGGGKGLLSYLLQQSGWSSTVIDPVHQELPNKYKDLIQDRQVRIAESERVPRIDEVFAPEMAMNFDLLVAVHAHGCNLQLIDAAAQHNCAFVILPCCVIGEPLLPPPGVHWIQFVVDYAIKQGFAIEPFRLNFKGQNIGVYAQKRGSQEKIS